MTDIECNTCYRVNSRKLTFDYWHADLKFVTTVTTGSRLKQISSCLNSSRKQSVSLQNLRRNMKFTNLFGKITHTFPPKLLKLHIFISISTKKGLKSFVMKFYVVLSLAKIVAIYAALVCKFVRSKLRSCKFFDKFQVWLHVLLISDL